MEFQLHRLRSVSLPQEEEIHQYETSPEMNMKQGLILILEDEFAAQLALPLLAGAKNELVDNERNMLTSQDNFQGEDATDLFKDLRECLKYGHNSPVGETLSKKSKELLMQLYYLPNDEIITFDENEHSILHLVLQEQKDLHAKIIMTFLILISHRYLDKHLAHKEKNNGDTVLHVIAQAGRMDMARLLLKCSKQLMNFKLRTILHLKNKQGQRPLDEDLVADEQKWEIWKLYNKYLSMRQLQTKGFSNPHECSECEVVEHPSLFLALIHYTTRAEANITRHLLNLLGELMLKGRGNKFIEELREELETPQRAPCYLKKLEAIELKEISNYWPQNELKSSFLEAVFKAAVANGNKNLCLSLFDGLPHEDMHQIIRGKNSPDGESLLCASVSKEDQFFTMLLLKGEHNYHKDKTEGLQCLRQQLRSNELLPWTIETFKLFYGRGAAEKHFTPALHALTIVLSLAMFVYDYVFDVSLAIEYWQRASSSPNTASLHAVGNTTRNSSCTDYYPTSSNYEVAFWLTCAFMLIPNVYFVAIALEDDLVPKRRGLLWMPFRLCGSLLIGPLSPFYIWLRYCISSIKHKRSREADKAESLHDLRHFESFWGLVKLIESTTESTGQLLIQVWFLTFYQETLSRKGFTDCVWSAIQGAFWFVSDADEFDRALGKLVISVLTLSWTVVSSYQKRKRQAVGFPHFSFLFLSTLVQVVLRARGFFVHFAEARVLSLSDGSSVHLVHLFPVAWFVCHYSVITVIKICYERSDCRSLAWQILPCSLVYVQFEPPTSRQRRRKEAPSRRFMANKKKTFTPHVVYFICTLFENLILVLMPSILLRRQMLFEACLGQHVLRNSSLLIVVLSVLSWIFHALFYRVYGHPWSDINGPALPAFKRRKSSIGSEELPNSGLSSKHSSSLEAYVSQDDGESQSDDMQRDAIRRLFNDVYPPQAADPQSPEEPLWRGRPRQSVVSNETPTAAFGMRRQPRRSVVSNGQHTAPQTPRGSLFGMRVGQARKSIATSTAPQTPRDSLIGMKVQPGRPSVAKSALLKADADMTSEDSFNDDSFGYGEDYEESVF